MKIRPLSDRVLLKSLEAEEKTKSGIILPDSAKEKPQEAKVVAVGSGKTIDGKKQEMSVAVGDKVIYEKYKFEDVKIDGEEYILGKEEDILAIVE